MLCMFITIHYSKLMNTLIVGKHKLMELKTSICQGFSFQHPLCHNQEGEKCFESQT